MDQNQLKEIIEDARIIKGRCLEKNAKYEQEHFNANRTIEQDDLNNYCDECSGEMKKLCDEFFKLTKETFITFEYDGNSHKPSAIITNLEEDDIVELTVTGEKVIVGANYVAKAGFADTQNNYALPQDVTTSFAITKSNPVYDAPAKNDVMVYTASQSPVPTLSMARFISIAALFCFSSFWAKFLLPYHIMALKYFSSCSSPS